MIGRNHHNKYRRSVYKRHSISAIIISSAVTLLVCAIAMLIFGNILHAKYQNENVVDDTQPTDSQESENIPYTPPSSIKAYSVLIETNDSSTFASRIDSLPDTYKSSVSIPLNTENGTLLYRSDTANSIGINTGEFSVKLSSVVDIAKSKGIYLSGVFYVDDFAIEDKLLRQVELSKSSAIISEALEIGLNEIMIIAPHATNDNVNELVRFIDDIKYNTTQGYVGLSVPDSIFHIEDELLKSEKILQLSKSADILAVDMSNVEQEKATEEIAQILKSENIYIHKYKMRLLLPKMLDDETQNSVISTAESASLNNWQIIE